MFVRLILILAILYIAYRMGRYIFQLSDEGIQKNRREITGEDLVKDPQCGTYVPKSSSIKATIGGEDHFFCSEDCRNKYREANKNKH